MPLIAITTCRKLEDYRQAVLHVGGEVRIVEPTMVIEQALAVEPAVLGVAADLARRMCERLEKYGVSEEHRAYIFTQCTLAGAISIHLMRHGNAELWRDLIEPDEDRKEVPND